MFGDGPCQTEADELFAASLLCDEALAAYEDALLLVFVAFMNYEECMNNHPQPSPEPPPGP